MRARIRFILITAMSGLLLTGCGTVDSASDASNVLSDSSSETETTQESTAAETTTSAQTTQAATEETTAAEPTTANEEPTTAKATEKPTEQATAAPTDAPVQTEPATEKPTDPEPTTSAPAGGSFSHNDMIFIHNGAQAALFSEASGLIGSLGAPSDVQEAQGCLSNGADQKIYYYPGLTLSTYVMNGQEIIYDIEITSSTYATSEGLKVGMAVSDMETMYGTNYQKSGNMYIYSDGSGEMYITASGGSITAIEYYGEV